MNHQLTVTSHASETEQSNITLGLVFTIGLTLFVASFILYEFVGYSAFVVGTWFGGVLHTGLGFYLLRKVRVVSADYQDLKVLIGLLAACTPFYLCLLYTLPWQVNSDEGVMIATARGCMASPNVFALTKCGGPPFPSLGFLLPASLAQILGGITLEHMRFVNALTGLAGIATCYVLFRLVSPRRSQAIIASLCVASNHAYLGLSRMAIRDAAPPLFETGAVALLLYGLKKECPLFVFLSGCVLGLAFYTYYPARITLILFFVLFAILALWFQSEYSRLTLAKFGFIAMLGFVLVAWPVAVTMQKDPLERYDRAYSVKQTLLTPEGLEHQRQRVGAKTWQAGYLINIINGISVFNNFEPDKTGLHWHGHHGFVDPISGLLLWIGIAFMLVRCKKDWRYAFMLAALLSEWFFFAFVVNKAPAYTRLLVILPFAGFVISEGLIGISSIAKRLALARRRSYASAVATLVLVGGMASIIVLNASIYGEYLKQGLENTGSIRVIICLGNIGRYVAAKEKTDPAHTFVLVSQPNADLMDWGIPAFWVQWTQGFLRKDRPIIKVMSLEAVKNNLARLQAPVSLFMTDSVFDNNKDIFIGNDLNLRIAHRLGPHEYAVEFLVDHSNDIQAPMLIRAKKIEEQLKTASNLDEQGEKKWAAKDWCVAIDQDVALRLADDLHKLGELYLRRGNFLRAEAPLVESLNMRRKLLGFDNPITQQTLQGLKNLYADEGRADKAQALASNIRRQDFWEKVLQPAP